MRNSDLYMMIPGKKRREEHDKVGRDDKARSLASIPVYPLGSHGRHHGRWIQNCVLLRAAQQKKNMGFSTCHPFVEK
jgi:hypothetical protein